MRQATFFELSCRIVIDRTVDTMIVNNMVMLKYVLLMHGTDVACVPEEAPGDIASANIDTHGVFYHHMWYKHEHERLTA